MRRCTSWRTCWKITVMPNLKRFTSRAAAANCRSSAAFCASSSAGGCNARCTRDRPPRSACHPSRCAGRLCFAREVHALFRRVARGRCGPPDHFRSAVSEGRRAAGSRRTAARDPAPLSASAQCRPFSLSGMQPSGRRQPAAAATSRCGTKFSFRSIRRCAMPRALSAALPDGAVAADRREIFHRRQRHGNHHDHQSHGRLSADLSPGPLGREGRAGNSGQTAHAASTRKQAEGRRR